MPSGAFNICCPRDCVSRHNGGTSGAPLKPLRVDSALYIFEGTQEEGPTGAAGAPAHPGHHHADGHRLPHQQGYDCCVQGRAAQDPHQGGDESKQIMFILYVLIVYIYPIYSICISYIFYTLSKASIV